MICEPSYRPIPRVLNMKRIETGLAAPDTHMITLTLHPDCTPCGDATLVSAGAFL